VRNIFLFIRRYFNFLFFLVLQIISLTFLFRYNKFHEAAFMGFANEISGRVGERYSNVAYYFNLKKENQALSRKNEELLNRLKQDYESADTGMAVIRDTINRDTLGHERKYVWKEARVVNNSVSLQNNYITIHRGEKQGVTKDMGVVSASGLVGTVVNTSDNYSVVMSLLNRQTSVSVKMKRTGEIGKVQWDGESPFYVTLTNVPKSVTISKGDSVVTSGYSLKFPEGILVGTVAEIVNDQTSNFYIIKLKPATDFFNVSYVYVVDNLQKDEQRKLEEATRKTNE
jgi:rod shape-determining protein MreC